MTKAIMIEEILIACKASPNHEHLGGEVFFALAFRTESELKHICLELGIKT